VRLLVFAAALAALASGCAESHLREEDGAIASTGVTALCATPMSGRSRDCGWRADATRTCTPGTSVRVACGVDCGLGSCSGDAMIRICAGSTDCRASGALAQDDDGCGSLCPETTLVCPPGGVYTILTAPFSSSSSYTCTFATTP
jgi:hypothetical protein